MAEQKVAQEPVAEKPEDARFETSSQVASAGKADSALALSDDANTKALTRKLLFKLDTRYASQGFCWSWSLTVLNASTF